MTIKKPSKRKPKKERLWAVCDSETDPFVFGRVPKPFIWGFFDGENYEEFSDTEDFVRFIYDKDIVIYAHNGGKFDWHFLLDWLNPGDDIMFINGRISQAKIGQCELRDSYNILPIPLAGFQKDVIDYAMFEESERIKPHNKKAISAYLQSDCRYLWMLVRAFIDRHGMRLTQAGAAMRLFENMYDIKAPSSSKEFFDEVRPYYYGGRVQCFQKGVKREKFRVIDINSAYPRAMLDQHPFGTDLIQVDATVDDSHEHPQLFYRVRAIADGCFPWREAVGKKLIYPTDNEVREYYVTGWEMRAALKLNAVKIVELISVYDAGETISFKDYILPLFEERKQCKLNGDKAGDILAKLAMNSLYGKFGADPSGYSRSRLFDVKDLDALMVEGIDAGNATYHFGGELGDSVCVGTRELFDSEMKYYNVATAASITGWVRAFLFESLRACKGVIYCDTDSIACTDPSGLDMGLELGQWKDEGEYDQWAVAGRKMYAFKHHARLAAAQALPPGEARDKAMKEAVKTACKGARLNADEIEAVARGETVTYTFDAPNFSTRHGARFVERDIRGTD